jgi:hypothetical protein
MCKFVHEIPSGIPLTRLNVSARNWKIMSLFCLLVMSFRGVKNLAILSTMVLWVQRLSWHWHNRRPELSTALWRRTWRIGKDGYRVAPNTKVLA